MWAARRLHTPAPCMRQQGIAHGEVAWRGMPAAHTTAAAPIDSPNPLSLLAPELTTRKHAHTPPSTRPRHTPQRAVSQLGCKGPVAAHATHG